MSDIVTDPDNYLFVTEVGSRMWGEWKNLLLTTIYSMFIKHHQKIIWCLETLGARNPRACGLMAKDAKLTLSIWRLAI